MDGHLEHSTNAAGVPPSYIPMVLRLYLRESYSKLKQCIVINNSGFLITLLHTDSTAGCFRHVTYIDFLLLE